MTCTFASRSCKCLCHLSHRLCWRTCTANVNMPELATRHAATGTYPICTELQASLAACSACDLCRLWTWSWLSIACAVIWLQEVWPWWYRGTRWSSHYSSEAVKCSFRKRAVRCFRYAFITVRTWIPALSCLVSLPMLWEKLCVSLEVFCYLEQSGFVCQVTAVALYQHMSKPHNNLEIRTIAVVICALLIVLVFCAAFHGRPERWCLDRKPAVYARPDHVHDHGATEALRVVLFSLSIVRSVWYHYCTAVSHCTCK